MQRANQFSWWSVSPSLAIATCLWISGSPSISQALELPVQLSAQPTPVTPLGMATVDPFQLLEQGQQQYEAGQFKFAIATLQQAITAFQAQDNFQGQAIALSNLALTHQQLGQFSEAEVAIQSSLQHLQPNTKQPSSHPDLMAQVLMIQGALQMAQGQTEAALQTWQNATHHYQTAKNALGSFRSQINQAQALQVLGWNVRALELLQSLEPQIAQEDDSFEHISLALSLGNAYRLINRFEDAEQVLMQGLTLAQKRQGAQADLASLLLSLGNTKLAQGNQQLSPTQGQDLDQVRETYFSPAARYYNQVIALEQPTITRVQAQLNLLKLAIQIAQQEAQVSLVPLGVVLPDVLQDIANPGTLSAILDDIEQQLTRLPTSRAKVYAQVSLAENLATLAQEETGGITTLNIVQRLADTVQEAEQIHDLRAKSYALGTLGHLYEDHQQWSDAQSLTEQALKDAKAINADELIYRWQWQLGRLLKAQNQPEFAIAAYDKALDSLEFIRGDLLTASSEIQFSFRDDIEPVYREYVSLLLADDQSPDIDKAVDLIERLQLDELNNYFRDNCLNTIQRQRQGTAITSIESIISQSKTQAAIIYPIILKDRLAVILSIPHQGILEYKTSPIPQQNLVDTVASLQYKLFIEPDRQVMRSLAPDATNIVPLSQSSSLALSQDIYSWLMKPLEPTLRQHPVQHLVFILDGELRNIPMSALFDGEQFLIEKYSISLTPGLSLLPPRPLNRNKFKVLTVGISENAPVESDLEKSLPKLENADDEVEYIKTIFPQSKVLLNTEFTWSTFQQHLQESSFPAVHLATHGNFSSQLEETYILSWDRLVRINEFKDLFQKHQQANRLSPVQLLVLSACETATGDSRATLGIAGFVVGAGVNTVIANIAKVPDESASLIMRDFYRQLHNNPNLSQIEALRNAQLKILQDSKNPEARHPSFWSTFVLVGNWL